MIDYESRKFPIFFSKPIVVEAVLAEDYLLPQKPQQQSRGLIQKGQNLKESY